MWGVDIIYTYAIISTRCLKIRSRIQKETRNITERGISMNKDTIKITEVLVLNPLRKDDAGISRLIKRTFGEDTVVTTIRSQNFYETPFGPANLVSQHKNKKNVRVCINRRGFNERTLEETARTGNLFILAFENEPGKWDGVSIGSFSETETPRIQKKNLAAA